MRIRAELDIYKPLIRCLRMCSPTGEFHRVTFSYERLPLFCYDCGVLSHIVKQCDRHYEVENSASNTEPQYRPWLVARSTSRRFAGGDTQPGSVLAGNTEKSQIVQGIRERRGAQIFDPTDQTCSPTSAIIHESRNQKSRYQQ
ncbi:UNVERIFIED_CONTAM: hypothetical protein Slati_2954600 [Sesamum latifolium]|uniref:Zinc knuckle CX2CX4HX4C domain-containing protein n=1 Tax=Sesamum latifolium TaxID=2727402 RepID=A0AAW2VF15_9LAMI